MSAIKSAITNLGRGAVGIVEDLGHVGSIFVESLFYLLLGPKRGQPVRWTHTLEQMRQIGADAVPIVALLALVIGLSLAINAIAQLKMFGAESKIVVGIANLARWLRALSWLGVLLRHLQPALAP